MVGISEVGISEGLVEQYRQVGRIPTLEESLSLADFTLLGHY
jgi:hypothetical protein